MLNKHRLLFAVPLVLGLLLVVTSVPCMAETTTFYVVRHAEKPEDGRSDRLTAVGMQRAQELASVLSIDPPSAVYSTETLRTWQTATPSAIASGVEIIPYGHESSLIEWATDLRNKHAGQSVLIVGHSNTIREIVKALGGQGNFPLHGYSDLFVVKIDDSGVNVDQRQYGVIVPLKGKVTFNGEIDEPDAISAIGFTANHRFLVIGSDETREIQVLKRAEDGYDVQHSIKFLPRDNETEKDEIDIEGIARHGNNDTFFIVGSHSGKRKNILKKKHEGKPYEKIKRMFEEQVGPEKSRNRLIQLRLNPDTGELVPDSLKDVTMRGILDNNKVLKLFSTIPGKENGIDIEGIASDGKNLYLGFRGPILRHGFVPVLVFPPDTPESAQLRYVLLEGQGIRDMTAVKDGFLIIAGPVGDAALPCKLYFWNGHDCLPGVRQDPKAAKGKVELLGTIPPPPGVKRAKQRAEAKAEGIAVINEDQDGTSFAVLIVYDGVKGGAPTRFRVAKP
jgi:broad specificity phosphatase PhoE